MEGQLNMVEFKAWPKTPRLFREMVITEKIDGTNAAVIIEPRPITSARDYGDGRAPLPGCIEVDGEGWFVGAQSRKRLITPESDNFGFAKWVRENATELVLALGEGYHFGEWWGSGIQRGYGLAKGEKRFSLFNVNRYADVSAPEIGLGTVPILFEGAFDTTTVYEVLHELEYHGSYAAPGFDKPEGVIVFHSAGGQVFKATIENDGFPKGQDN